MALTYFTEAELRALPQMSDTTRYPTARVTAVGEGVEALIERAVGTSFTARTVTGEIHDGGRDAIVLLKPFVVSVTSATEDGVAVTDSLRMVNGVLRRFSSASSYTPLTWVSGTGNVAVTYQAGYSSTPPADIKEATLQVTRDRLLSSAAAAAVTGRRTTMNSEAGTVTYALVDKDHPTGHMEADAVIIGWRDRLDLFGFA